MSFALTDSQRTRCARIMKKYSVTYWNATRFFSASVRDKVLVLYRWVREADELVDNPKTDPATALEHFEDQFLKAWNGKAQYEVHDLMVQLAQECGIEKAWLTAFLRSMRQDLKKHTYRTQAELDEYIYGSAEVIGLMMARVMGVADEFLPSAQALGKWMQLVNFLRDAGEDWHLRQRVYLPQDLLDKHSIVLTAKKKDFSAENWEKCVRENLSLIENTKKVALKGFVGLPRFFQFPIYVATVLYQWSLDTIEKNPQVVWQRQVKPSPRVILSLLPQAWLGYISKKFI